MDAYHTHLVVCTSPLVRIFLKKYALGKQSHLEKYSFELLILVILIKATSPQK